MSAVRGEYQPCAGDEHHQVIPLAASSALSHLWTQCSGYSWQCHSTVQKGHLSSVREIWRGEIPALPPTLLCRCPQLTVLSVIKQNQTCHQTLCKPLQVWGCACVLDLITSLCFIIFFYHWISVKFHWFPSSNLSLLGKGWEPDFYKQSSYTST